MKHVTLVSETMLGFTNNEQRSERWKGRVLVGVCVHDRTSQNISPVLPWRCSSSDYFRIISVGALRFASVHDAAG